MATEEKGYTWEAEYERTWEALREDESGSLQSSIVEIVNKAKRKRLLERQAKLRLGIMRHVFVIVDLSSSMDEKDLNPTRQQCTLKLLDLFINEFFDQNPIGQLGFIVARNKRAEKISELSGNSRKHLDALRSVMTTACAGEMSLQNSLEMALQTLKLVPSHSSREILVIIGSLSTCDPGNVNNTIELLKLHKIRCCVIGLAAELFVCKRLCNETGGTYSVPLDELHFKDVLSAFTFPPLCPEGFDSNLIKMGFPSHKVTLDVMPSMCICHSESGDRKGYTESGYFCPQCQSKYCELPVECKVCGLTLVSAPHLARSYHHLMPILPFIEQSITERLRCFACCCDVEHKCYLCGKCNQMFCVDCDLFIHETLNTCPGCQSL